MPQAIYPLTPGYLPPYPRLSTPLPQASLTPREPVAPLALCGAMVITGSISLILLYKAREKPRPPPARAHRQSHLEASSRQTT